MSVVAISLLVVCLVVLGQKTFENRHLAQQLEALTAPSDEAQTECVRMHVAAFRLMEARQHGVPYGPEAHDYALGRLLVRGTSMAPRYQRYFEQMQSEVWSYSREIGADEQERVADAYSELVEAGCLETYSPRIVHPQIRSAEVCAPDKKDLCDAIPAARAGEELCDEMQELARRTGHYINASRDTISVLAPSFERDRTAGKLSKSSIESAIFLKEASEITLGELEAATGMLAIAAREMCDFG